MVEKLIAVLNTYRKQNHGRARRRKKAAAIPVGNSPKIAKTDLRVIVEVNSKKEVPYGVALAQGGREHGYSLHFIQGRPAFDVRKRQGDELVAMKPVRGQIRLEGVLNRKTVSLSVNRQPVASQESPGLIPVQPKDELSVNLNKLSAAGNYEAPTIERDGATEAG